MKTVKDLPLLLLLPLVSVAAVPAFAGADDIGTTAGQFLKVPVGARGVAMGEAYSAVVDDASAVFWNPAALTRIENRSATFMHASLLDTVILEFVGYGQTLEGIGSLGGSIQYLSAGKIDKTDSAGFKTGDSFTPSDLALGVSYAREIRDFSVGITAKFISSKLTKSASTVAGDLGVLSPRYLDGRLVFALGVQNLGGKLKFDQASDPLPLNIRAGSALSWEGGWNFGVDLNLPKDNKLVLVAGAEKNFGLQKFDVAVRLGYNTRTSGEVDGLTGLSTGAGITFKRFRLDYALVLFGDLGPTHRISLSTRF